MKWRGIWRDNADISEVCDLTVDKIKSLGDILKKGDVFHLNRLNL